MNEASARIKINKLLEEAGWRFFNEPVGPANIRLEIGVKIESAVLNDMGNDFKHIKSKRGGVGFFAEQERLPPCRSRSQVRDQGPVELQGKATFGITIEDIAWATEVKN